jgi:WD40 repeat protein
MRSHYLPAVFLLAPFLAPGQPALVGTPGMGVAYDSRSMTLRAIRGIPGASLLGDAIETGTPFVYAAISPLHELALGVTQDGQVRLVRFGGSPASQSLDAAHAAPTGIMFAPRGRAALLIGAQIQLVTGLDNVPVLSDLALPGLSETPVAAALSDDGLALMLASGTVWLTTPDGGATQLPLPGTIVTAAFRANSHDAVAVTRSGDVYTIRDAGPNAEVHQLYTGDDATADPAGVRFSPDGTRVFVASAGGTLSAIDVRTGTVAASSCNCKPTGLDPLRGGTVFRLNEISNGPLMLFDASTSDSRFWFVPADNVADGEQGSAR